MMGAYAQSDFDTLYRDSYNNLLRLAYRSTKDYHESEDLVDEAFVIYPQKSEIVHIDICTRKNNWHFPTTFIIFPIF